MRRGGVCRDGAVVVVEEHDCTEGEVGLFPPSIFLGAAATPRGASHSTDPDHLPRSSTEVALSPVHKTLGRNHTSNRSPNVLASRLGGRSTGSVVRRVFAVCPSPRLLLISSVIASPFRDATSSMPTT